MVAEADQATTWHSLSAVGNLPSRVFGSADTTQAHGKARRLPDLLCCASTWTQVIGAQELGEPSSMKTPS